MARWQESSHGGRYPHADELQPYQYPDEYPRADEQSHQRTDQGQRYWQHRGSLDALLGGGLVDATATAPEDPGHRRHGAASPATASSGASASATSSGSDEDPATGATQQFGTVEQDSWYRRARIAFRQWRRTRPFWGGLFCLLGGALMAYGPLSVFRYVLVAGTVIWAGVLIGLLVCTMGLFLWLAPQYRQLVGILAAVFSIVSLITSNLGGFVVGLLLGSFGGALGFAWTPLPADEQRGASPGVPPPEDGQPEDGQPEDGQPEDSQVEGGQPQLR